MAHRPAPARSTDSRSASARLTAAYDRLRKFVDAGLAPDARDDSLATVACWLVIVAGIFWRFVDLGYPPYFTFDEHHFVENARNYLHGVADWNDHPPLGKLLIVPGILAFGDNGLGWRVHAAVLGVAHIWLVWRLAAALFGGERRTALLAAAFVAADGLFVSYSRTALLDIPMNVFMLGALVLMVEGRTLVAFAAAAASLGLAVSVKWIAVLMFLAVPLLLRRRRLSVFHSLWLGPLVLVVYGAVNWVALAITHQPVTLASLVMRNAELLKHHAGFTTWENPADSRWYTWPFLVRSIILHRAELPHGYVRVTSTVGNPLLWFATTVMWLVVMYETARGAWARLKGVKAEGAAALGEGEKTRAFLLLLAMVLILQWMLTDRESYIWHYMGSYTLGLVLLADRVTVLWRRDGLKAALVLLVVGAVSAFYSPVWTNGCLHRGAYMARVLVSGWR